MRLEFRPARLERTYIDIWLETGESATAIELKYVTRRLSTTAFGEHYELNNHGAQDIRRYDFIKDIARLERVVESVPNTSAIAIFLTNDDTYWRSPRSLNQIDAAFRIHEGQMLHGTHVWTDAAGPGATQGRTEPIVLRGS